MLGFSHFEVAQTVSPQRHLLQLRAGGLQYDRIHCVDRELQNEQERVMTGQTIINQRSFTFSFTAV